MASPSSMRQLSPCLTSQPGLRLLGTGRIFALITGVNSYQYPYALHGAVNDAEAIADYLRKNFVDCKCKMLLDDQATRAAIEANFCDFLINNDDIGQGDPIIFYFAGHGSEICEDCDDIKQAICPHDFDIMNEGPTSIKLDQIREWLQFVAAKRGNNIVVILDCCYNAPASAMNYLRDQAVVRVRCIPSRTDVSPETQERHLKQDRHPTSMRGGVPYFPWIDAYVLMHACRRSEPAIEEPSPRCPGTPARGAFTSALIEHLIDIDQREEQTTYKLLVCGLSGLPQGQHPFCVGLHRDRYLWSMAVAEADRRIWRAILKVDYDSYYLYHPGYSGIRVGDTFNVVKDGFIGLSNMYGKLVSISEQRYAHGEVCICKAVDAVFDIPEDAVACLSERSIKTTAKLGPRLCTARNRKPSTCDSMILVDEDPEVEVEVEKHGPRLDLSITRNDTFLEKYARRKITVKVLGDETLKKALENISRFNYHLYRTPQVEESGRHWDITVRLQRFERENPDVDLTLGDPSPTNTYFANAEIAVPSNRAPQGTMQLKEGNFKYHYLNRYAIELENKSKDDLYVWVFMFDPEKYTITTCYGGPESENDMPPLRGLSHTPRKRILSIGASMTEDDPAGEFFKLDLDVERTTATHFLKIFASTEYTNLKAISQSLPTEQASSTEPQQTRSHTSKTGFTDLRAISRRIWDGSVSLRNDSTRDHLTPSLEGRWQSWMYALKVVEPY